MPASRQSSQNPKASSAAINDVFARLAFGSSQTIATAAIPSRLRDSSIGISVAVHWEYAITDNYGAEDPHDALTSHFKDFDQRPFLAVEDGVRLSLAGGQKETALAILDATGAPRLGLPKNDDQRAIAISGAPSTGIGVIAGATTDEVRTSCETMGNLYEMQAEIDPTQANPEERDMVCGLQVPTKDELWSSIKSAPGAAWDGAVSAAEGTADWATSLERPDFGGAWQRTVNTVGDWF